MRKHNSDYVLAQLEAALSNAVDTLHAAALCAIETRGRVPCPTPVEAEAYVDAAVTAAALRLGMSAETIAAADREARKAVGRHAAPVRK